MPRRIERDQRAGREVDAIGEIDDIQYAEHQREAERKKSIGCAGDDAVDELLGEHGGLGLSTKRHGRACPGHPRTDEADNGIDARHKAGHGAARQLNCRNFPSRISMTTTPDVSAGSRFSVNANGPMTPVYFTLPSASLIFSGSAAPAALIALVTMNSVS